METVPIHQVKDVGFPIVVLAQVSAIRLEPGKTPELRGDMVGDSGGADSELYFAGGEIRSSAEDVDSGGKVAGGDDIRESVQLGGPGLRTIRILSILMAFHVDQSGHRVKGSQRGKNLEDNVSFREQSTPRGAVGDAEGGLEAENEAFTVGVNGESECAIAGNVEPL